MAATGTPTPNIGLRRPQGTDPASVDDINYNSNLIDTKLGAVGNTSVQAQINSLNSKLTMTSLLSQLNIPTSPTSYSCNWSEYRVLVIQAMYYGNVNVSIVVPTSYFNLTADQQRPIVRDVSGDITWDVYKNGINAVYIKASKESATRGISIYGFI